MKKLGLALALLVAACTSSQDPTASSEAGISLPEPTGAIDSWLTLNALPIPRGNHCAVAANGYLVVIGGNYKPAGATSFVNIAEVHVAKLLADGTIGAWSLAGTAPSPVNSCTAAVDGSDLLLLDGIYEDETKTGKIWRSTLSAAGTIGAWSEDGALPADTRLLYSDAVTEDRHLFTMMSNDDGTAVLSAETNSLGAWHSTTWLDGFRGRSAYAYAKVGQDNAIRHFVYALGGYAAGSLDVFATGAGAGIDPKTQTPTESFAVPPLPKPTAFGRAVAIQHRLFLVGGKDGQILTAAGRPDVFSAPIGDDGTVGDWQATAPLPEGRTAHAIVASGDYLYVLGGGFEGGGLDTVFAARIRPLGIVGPGSHGGKGGN